MLAQDEAKNEKKYKKFYVDINKKALAQQKINGPKIVWPFIGHFLFFKFFEAKNNSNPY